MPAPVDLEAAVMKFVSGGEFWPLWRVTMDLSQVIDELEVSKETAQWCDDVYDLVYMGGEGEPDAADRAVGVLGAAELRTLLQAKLASRPSLSPEERQAPNPDAS
jgi:hypothetical protein